MMFSKVYISLTEMSAHRVAASLPRIGVTIGHTPQKLKTGGIEPSRRARLEVLRRIVTRTVREERVELKWNRAVEARPYVERVCTVFNEFLVKNIFVAVNSIGSRKRTT